MSTVSLLLVSAGWLAGFVLLWRLPTPGPPGAATASSVSIIIPARDEATSLPLLLESLRPQEPQPLEVIVVDDGSTDGTAEVASAAGARVVSAPPPPTDWLGKPWACEQGAQAASGEILLLLDADTRLAPDGVARLVHAHRNLAPDGLLSVQPFHQVSRPHEQLSAVCNVVPLLASGIAVPGPGRSSRVAFGPCLVVRVEALRAVGGFAAVRGEIVEDAALAAAFRSQGRDVRCLAGGSTVRFRMYPDGLRSLVQGWTKNLAGGAMRAPLMPLVGAVLWVCAAMSVTAAAVLEPGPAVGVAWLVTAAQLAWMLRRIGSFHWTTSVVFPVPVVAFVALFVTSAGARLLGRPVTWRGRRIDPRGAGRSPS